MYLLSVSWVAGSIVLCISLYCAFISVFWLILEGYIFFWSLESFNWFHAPFINLTVKMPDHFHNIDFMGEYSVCALKSETLFIKEMIFKDLGFGQLHTLSSCVHTCTWGMMLMYPHFSSVLSQGFDVPSSGLESWRHITNNNTFVQFTFCSIS